MKLYLTIEIYLSDIKGASTRVKIKELTGIDKLRLAIF
jgi:hypothetical protein